MKKYTIKDNLGNKKTIYAKDLAHALRLNDDNVVIYKNIQIFALERNNLVIVNGQWLSGGGKYGKAQPNEKIYRTNNINAAIRAYKLYLDKFVAENKQDIDVHKNAYWDSKAKDEANLPTTLQALVNDEEAAIKAYEVAIKNLEGKIDEIQMQVLINIMKDERRHVENLYAILNGQVTEKNLEDSKIKDEIITIGNTEYRLYSRYGSYHLDELKTNERVADFDSYSEAMASIRQWKKLGYVTDSNDDKITEKNLEDSVKDHDVKVRLKPDEIKNVKSYNLIYKDGTLFGDYDDINNFMIDYGYWTE